MREKICRSYATAVAFTIMRPSGLTTSGLNRLSAHWPLLRAASVLSLSDSASNHDNLTYFTQRLTKPHRNNIYSPLIYM